MRRYTDHQLEKMYSHISDAELARHIAYGEANIPLVKSGPMKGVPHLSWSLRMDELNAERRRRQHGTQNPVY